MQHHRHRICPLDRLIEAVPHGSSILDIGCGGGLLIAHLACAGRARAALGIDSSADAIAVAKAMAPRLRALAPEGVDIRFEHRPVQHGLPDHHYDAVCLIDVMHHVPPAAQEKAFRDAAERVRPGGRFVYKDMCATPMWRAGMNRLHDLAMARQWIRYVPIATIERWAEQAGLTMRHTDNINIIWYGHELRVFERPEGPAL